MWKCSQVERLRWSSKSNVNEVLQIVVSTSKNVSKVFRIYLANNHKKYSFNIFVGSLGSYVYPKDQNVTLSRRIAIFINL